MSLYFPKDVLSELTPQINKKIATQVRKKTNSLSL